MFHLFSGLQTAILFSICSANLRQKLQVIKSTESNDMAKAIKLKDFTGDSSQKLSNSFTHRQLNNNDVRNNLSKFSMARRYGNPFSNYESVPFSSESNRRTYSFETYERSKTNELREMEDDEMLDVLYKQTILMEKLAQVIESEHYSLRSKNDFDDLLSEVDLSKIKKKPTTSTTSTTKARIKKQLSTIMTVVDETEVRAALKRDPLVKRILKMANRKRIRYVEAAKKYFN